MITVPLSISSSYLDSYTPVINPYFTSSVVSTNYFTNDGIYKTVIEPSPIKTFVSPLGVAAHPEPIVFHHKYHRHKPKKTSKITVASPVLSTVLSPAVSKVTSLNSISSYNTVDVNSDPSLRRKVSQYFYDETVNKWLYSEFNDLLNYLVVKNGEVSLIKDLSKVDNNNNDKNIEEKIEYIANNVMTKYDVRSYLKKYVIKSGLNWYDLKDNKKYVKKSLYKKIKKNLEKMIVHE
jgi:hypothetical protein